VYVEYDGHQVKLTTEDGATTHDTIYLDGNVLLAFDAYMASLRAYLKERREA
jgi:hypothetical protein